MSRHRNREVSDLIALVVIAVLIVCGGGMSLLAMCGVGR